MKSRIFLFCHKLYNFNIYYIETFPSNGQHCTQKQDAEIPTTEHIYNPRIRLRDFIIPHRLPDFIIQHRLPDFIIRHKLQYSQP